MQISTNKFKFSTNQLMHFNVSDVKSIYITEAVKQIFFRPVTDCLLAYMYFQICTFYNFCREVGQLSGQQHANIITLFHFNSRILVENFVVGIRSSCMFLVFHEFEMKYTSTGI